MYNSYGESAGNAYAVYMVNAVNHKESGLKCLLNILMDHILYKY